MDHIKIIKRAFTITVNYRALWVFGILLALTTAGAGGGSGGGGGNGGGGGGSLGPSNGWPGFSISTEVMTALIVGGIVLLCVIFLLAIVGTVVRYVSETALIRMVDQHETTGEKRGVRAGFRLGWSRAALRLFLLDLGIGLAGFIVFALLLLITAAPLLVWLTESTVLRVLGTVLTVGLGLVLIFTAIVVAIVMSLLLQFFHRAIVLENLGVLEGARRGWQVLRQRLGDVVVMGLILFALGLAWAIVMIPVVLLLVAVAAIAGGLPALLVGMVVSLMTEGVVPWIAAALVGFPIFALVLGVPLTFLSGLVETFRSSTWTLTYRDILALGNGRPAPEAGPQPEASPQPEPPVAA